MLYHLHRQFFVRFCVVFSHQALDSGLKSSYNYQDIAIFTINCQKLWSCPVSCIWVLLCPYLDIARPYYMVRCSSNLFCYLLVAVQGFRLSDEPFFSLLRERGIVRQNKRSCLCPLLRERLCLLREILLRDIQFSSWLSRTQIRPRPIV